MMFDYELYARRHNVNQDTLESILGELREEFHGDQMMVELHAIRVIKNIIEQEE